nr:hypothetical protein [Brevibacillus laterosporus]
MLNVYASAFDGQMWINFLSSWESWSQILLLVGLEGLLSADNALVLAVMVAVLPVHQRKKALFYGFAGAILFRFFFIGLGNYLTSILWIKLIGAAYLAWLAISHFTKKNEVEQEEGYDVSKADKGWMVAVFGMFWATVIRVEGMDLAFSVDSILAALAVSNQLPILLLGGILGILMMRAVAGVFLRLIERIPQMETTAYVLIAIIAVKMGISEWVPIDHWLFFGVLVSVFLGTFVVAKVQNQDVQLARDEVAATKEEE